MSTKREVTDRIQKRIEKLKARVAELEWELGAMPRVPENVELVPIEVMIEAADALHG